MTKRTILTAFATLVLALIMGTTAFAQDNRATTEKYDFENPFYYNPCCDELISLTGTVHFTHNMTTNPDGTITISTRDNVSNVKGTGSNGTRYVGAQNSQSSQTFDPEDGLPFSFSHTSYIRVIATKGSDCSAKIRVTHHFSVDADGNITLDHFEVEFLCANGNEVLL